MLWPIFKIITSILAHIGFICCLVIVIWSCKQYGSQSPVLPKGTESNYHYYYLISSSIAGGLYIIVLVEAASSETYQYIRNFSAAQSAEEYVERVRDARPLVRWHAECYHYEIRTQARLQRDFKGRVNIRHLRHKEKVVTHREAEAFRFDKWKDLSRDINGCLQSAVVRVCK